MQAVDKETVEQLKTNSRRSVVYPSAADLQRARDVYQTVVEEWAGISPHNRDLLTLALAELKKLRMSN